MATQTRSIVDILKIDRLDLGRCSGKRKDGLPCGNVVASSSCSRARSILPTILEDPAFDTRTKERLEELAGWLLCRRWHQSQSTTLVRSWQEILSSRENRLRAIANNDRSNRGSRRTIDSTSPTEQRRAARSPSSNDQPIERPHTRAYARLLATITASNLTAEEKLNMIEAALSLMNDGAPDESSGLSTTAAELDSAPTSRERQQAQRSTVRTGSRNQQSNRTSDTPRGHSLTSSPTSVHTSSPEPHPGTRAVPRSGVSRSSTATSQETPYRESHDECGVCQESYEEDEEYWQCAECDNRTHAACFRTWASSRDLDATCVYCRTPVL